MPGQADRMVVGPIWPRLLGPCSGWKPSSTSRALCRRPRHGRLSDATSKPTTMVETPAATSDHPASTPAGPHNTSVSAEAADTRGPVSWYSTPRVSTWPESQWGWAFPSPPRQPPLRVVLVFDFVDLERRTRCFNVVSRPLRVGLVQEWHLAQADLLKPRYNNLRSPTSSHHLLPSNERLGTRET